MSRESNSTNILLGVCLALSLSAMALVVAAPALLSSAWYVRGGIALVVAVAVTPVVLVAVSQRRRGDSAAQALFDQLSRCDLAALNDEESLAQLQLPSQHPWNGTLFRIRESMSNLARRCGDAEHARARVEIRTQRIAAERKQLAEILSGLNDPVLAIDQYDELLMANPSAELALQITHGSEKRALEQLVHCQQLIELLRDTRRRKAPSTRTADLTLKDAEGQDQAFRVTCRSLSTESHDDRTAPHGAVAVLHDIGQLRQIQRRNAEFVSSVSHEMKAPLSGIRAYVELLADGEAQDEATRQEFLGVIHTQAERLQRLVENLLNLARIEAGVVEVLKQPRSLNELMEDAINVIAPAAEAKQIHLKSDLSPMYLEVLADRDMILQAVINLLSNAVKYTSAGGTVTLRTRMQDHQAMFEVEDTGVGLSPEDCQRVFEKFYRVKKDSQMAPGTGLGLPLAKHIVEDVHDGTLVVESVPGKGSIFRAILPNAGCLVAAK